MLSYVHTCQQVSKQEKKVKEEKENKKPTSRSTMTRPLIIDHHIITQNLCLLGLPRSSVLVVNRVGGNIVQTTLYELKSLVDDTINVLAI